ncbi:hypothetical protein HET69_25395 [Streptomyces sp. CJ_13]|uniref:hypothetical protein n=1 Tax=Streptomyces sp. CJ_13 TaxID=2724943 RepID=UPI001BDBF41D|nr:hypothetical protein [Streptomyces sp. CJ_13]MBT1187241.1 hypothetical protein [Streptomyces sp. CJ_13]
MTAMLHARSARAGDSKASQRAVGAAFDSYDRIDASSAEPACTYWVNRGKLNQLAGSSTLNLSNPAQALTHFRAAGAAQNSDAYDDAAFSSSTSRGPSCWSPAPRTARSHRRSTPVNSLAALRS